MNNNTSRLPADFEALEPFVDEWALGGAANRMQRRLASSERERVAFFNVAKPLLVPALSYLDRKPLQELDEKEQRLMNLLLTLCHVSLAVEIQGDAEAEHAQDARHLTITRATADQRA